MAFRILFQDEWLVAIDKPAGFQVHQPEDQRFHVSKAFDCLYILRRQIDRYLYPVHRLDRATSGVLLFALDPDTARKCGEAFQKHRLRKTYYCVTRGWTEEKGCIEQALDEKESKTDYQRVAKIELPHAVGKYPTARYSLVRSEPQSGRMHQIRRHFSRLAHPLVGDTIYGDGSHNRFFRDRLKTRALLLKAHSLDLNHPVTEQPLKIQAKWKSPWHEVFELFGVCPL